MSRKPDLDALGKKLAKVQREIRRAKAGEKQRARDEDTRRKVIAGALALNHYEKNPGSEFARTMFRLLDEYTLPDARHLFAFLPVNDAPPSPALASETPPAHTPAGPEFEQAAE